MDPVITASFKKGAPGVYMDTSEVLGKLNITNCGRGTCDGLVSCPGGGEG